MDGLATAPRTRSCIFMLQHHGDLQIEWSDANQAEIVQAFQSLMDQGVTFFIRAPEGTEDSPAVRAIGSVDEIAEHKSVFIKDPDIAKIVEAGFARLASFKTTGEIRTIGTAKTAEEAAAADTVAVQPKKGG
jgi:hypothetical protein